MRISDWSSDVCSSDLRHKGEAIAYSLILGGAMGNLIDRVFRGYVVDSFDFYWRDWHWPAFNLADIAIVFGALLFVSGSFLGKKTTDRKSVVSGKNVSVRVDLGGRRIITKNHNQLLLLACHKTKTNHYY